MKIFKSYTVEEALAEGYSYCGEDGDERFESLDGLDKEWIKDRINSGSKIFLAEKNPVSLRMGDSHGIFENILENSELSEAGWEDAGSFLSEYAEELDELLQKIGNAADKAKASNTYNLTAHPLILTK